jgi:peptidoglycan lytic transglycosylase
MMVRKDLAAAVGIGVRNSKPALVRNRVSVMSVPGFEPCVFAGDRRWRGVASLGVIAVALAGCAAQSPQVSYSHGHEHFSQAKYGHASPKVVADGQPVPRGGGQYLIGRPYSVAGHRYYPSEDPSYSAVGMASWYGAAFHGRRTANGEVYDMASLSAAHPTMPLPSYARVTNLSNGYSVIVRVNDRGPYSGGRVMDVSSRVAQVLDFKGAGTARVKVEYVGRAPMEGSDDSYLLASLRTDGSPATMIGYPAPVMMAAAQTETIFSFFSGRGESQTPPPPPEPVQAASRPASAPEPEPEPLRVAAAAEAPAAETAPIPEPATVALRQPHGAVPLPPSRPFDLGSNRSSLVVAAAAASSAGHFVMPPRRPDLQASAEKALYFSDPPLPPLKSASTGAFDRLKAVKSTPTAD